MIRGTTPTHRFELPFSVENVSDALIVYSQNGEEVLRKTVRHCHMVDKTLSVDLTQEETFRFRCDRKVRVQVRVLTNDGRAMASNVLNIDVGECLSDDVLGGDVTPSETAGVLGAAILGTMKLL